MLPTPMLGKSLPTFSLDHPAMVKRPRGRPPLLHSSKHMYGSAINRMTMNKHINSMRHLNNSVAKLPLSNQLKVSSSYSKLQLVNTITTSSAKHITSPSISSKVKDLAATPSSSHGTDLKFPRPLYTEVANKLLSFLMISEPKTATTLCKEFCEVPKDMILNILEVLSTLGIVIKVRSRDGPKSDMNAKAAYTIASFSKFSCELPYQQIAEETELKQVELQTVNGRIRELRELTSLELSADDRTRRLVDLLQAFIASDPALRNDSLYDTLFRSLEQRLTVTELT